MEKKNFKAPSMKKLTERVVSPKMEDEKSRTYDPRPVVNFSETDLPQIRKWTIDEPYTLVIKVDMTGIREEDYGANKGKKVASFKVISVGVQESEKT